MGRVKRRFVGPYSPELVKWLEARSLENVIQFFKDDLLSIEATGVTPPGLSQTAVKHLRRCGVVLGGYVEGRTTRCMTLTPEAALILHRGDTKMCEETPHKGLKEYAPSVGRFVPVPGRGLRGEEEAQEWIC